MSETETENKSKGGEVADSTQKIEVEVSNEQVQSLLERLNKEEEKAEQLTADLKAAQEAKKTAEKNLEEKTTESEDFRAKLQLIADQKFAAKKAVVIDEFKKVITDEERLKKIEEGIKTKDDLKATQFMLKTLIETMEQGRKEWEASSATKGFEDNKKALLEKFPNAKDKIEVIKKLEDLETLKKELEGASAPAEPVGEGGKGQIPLTSAQIGKVAGEGYESYAAMVRDLRKRAHSDDPEESAEAEAILDELFRRWSVAVKREYEGKMRGISVESGEEQPSLREITKKGGAAKPKPQKRKFQTE